jgi:cytochrome c biogenesis protein
MSLFLRRRRLWLRVAADEGGGTVVELAGLDRAHGGNLDEELDELVARLGGSADPDASAKGPDRP